MLCHMADKQPGYVIECGQLGLGDRFEIAARVLDTRIIDRRNRGSPTTTTRVNGDSETVSGDVRIPLDGDFPSARNPALTL